MCATSRDPHQHDRQVAGDPVGPQARLPAAVARDQAARRAQRRVRVQHVAREPLVELGVGARWRRAAGARPGCGSTTARTRDPPRGGRGTSRPGRARRRGSRRSPVTTWICARLVRARAPRGCGSRRSDRAPRPRCRSSAARCIAIGSITDAAAADERRARGLVRGRGRSACRARSSGGTSTAAARRPSAAAACTGSPGGRGGARSARTGSRTRGARRRRRAARSRPRRSW